MDTWWRLKSFLYLMTQYSQINSVIFLISLYKEYEDIRYFRSFQYYTEMIFLVGLNSFETWIKQSIQPLPLVPTEGQCDTRAFIDIALVQSSAQIYWLICNVIQRNVYIWTTATFLLCVFSVAAVPWGACPADGRQHRGLQRECLQIRMVLLWAAGQCFYFQAVLDWHCPNK